MENLRQLHSKALGLLDSNVQAAVDLVLGLPEDDPNISQLKAAILIDGGYKLKSEPTILQGIKIFEYVLKHIKNKSLILYNIANGLNDITILRQKSYGDNWKTKYKWYMDTIKERLLAKNNYFLALKGQTNQIFIAQILINRANMLYTSFRWIEATHEYCTALKQDPRNGIAAGGIIKQIFDAYHRTAANKNWLSILIPPLYKTIVENREYTIRHCGIIEYQQMMSLFDKWKIQNIPTKTVKMKRGKLTPYQDFIFCHELYLSPFMCRELFIPDLCDSLQIQTYISKVENDKSMVPTIYAMFNTIKADFLTVRWLAFNYFHAKLPKNSYYHDTLDYAVYGTKPSLLTITQRLCFDTLDKIAVAVLSLVGDPRASKSCFKDAWFYKDTKKGGCYYKLYPIIAKEIEKGNRALIALSELAFDIFDYYKDGCSYLKIKHKLRNSSTHRFTVMHDMGFNNSDRDCAVDHYALNDIESELIETLLLIKSAIGYLVEAIYYQNGILNNESGGRFITLDVPSHKRIRGENS